MSSETIILASASPRRREILAEHGEIFETIPSGAKELDDEHANPQELCSANASAKAREIAHSNPRRIVLGADTIVVLDGKIYGKPKNLSDARRMLAELSGREHVVYTGVSAVRFDGTNFDEHRGMGESRVLFRKLDAAAIEEYLRRVEVLDKAGAYAAQEHGSLIIERIDGEFDNVMGLPYKTAKKLLDAFRSAV